MSFSADLDRVLLEDDWLRRMARQLVGDSHACEDLAQDAWVAALSRGRTDRPWLFGVLRNLRREGVRRRSRDEDLVSKLSLPCDSPPTDDTVSELMLRKHVTERLLELAEPYRTAIFLRFVHDEKLPAIAKRTGVAVSTVHQRIARGLEIMRTSLDEHYDGERKSWAFGLLSLVKPPGVAESLSGGLIMGASAKVVAALILVSGTLAVVWNEDAKEEVTGNASLAPITITDQQATEVGPLEVATVSKRRAIIDVEAVLPDDVETESPQTAATTAGLVLNLDGLPVPGVNIGVKGASDLRMSVEPALSDNSGRFELTGPNQNQIEHRLECLDREFITILGGTPSNSALLVVVGRVADFAGVVVDQEGRPIANADLRFDLRQSLFRELSIPRPFEWSQQALSARSTQSDELGRFELPRVTGGRHVALWVAAGGFESQTVSLPAAGDTALRIVLIPRQGERVIRGYVLNQAGMPVPGASVAAGEAIVKTDARGAFTLTVTTGPPSKMELAEGGVWESMYDTSILRAALAGFLPAELPMDEIESDQQVILRLGSSTLKIAGHVVDENGLPRSGVIVWAADLTMFGFESTTTGDSKASWEVTIEEVNGSENRGWVSRSDDTGYFALSGLLDRDYQLWAFDTASAAQSGPERVAAGATDHEFTLVDEAGTMRVAGQIVTASGLPIEGVSIKPRRDLSSAYAVQPPYMPGAVLEARSDEEGRFVFESLATRDTVLELQHESFLIDSFDLKDQADLSDLLIVQAILCELEVELEWSAGLGDRLQVLDENDLPLQLIQSLGAFIRAGEIIEIVAGKSGVFQVNENARTLVLNKDGLEVARKSIRITPSKRNLVRL